MPQYYFVCQNNNFALSPPWDTKPPWDTNRDLPPTHSCDVYYTRVLYTVLYTCIIRRIHCIILWVKYKSKIQKCILLQSKIHKSCFLWLTVSYLFLTYFLPSFAAMDSGVANLSIATIVAIFCTLVSAL